MTVSYCTQRGIRDLIFPAGVIRVTSFRMKRIWLMGLCLAGVAVPAVVTSVFVFGCCVLPFHRTIHRLFPICGGIVKVLTPESHHQQTTPPRDHSKASFARAIFAKRLPSVAFFSSPAAASQPLRPIDRLAQSAMRCDDDVGLHLLLAILLV